MNGLYYNVHLMNTIEKQDSITLEILETIEKNDKVTQRNLANHLGVALGLANSYLKRCARKGFIKIQQVPANRYLYFLTPKGLAEKSRLSAQYLSSSFDFYRHASRSFSAIYTDCAHRQWHRVLLCGLSELTEIAYIRAQEFEVDIIGIWAPDATVELHLGIPVYADYLHSPECDAYLLTALQDNVGTYGRVIEFVDEQRLYVPEILGLRTNSIHLDFE
jgi:DNA-binding MarR family transcriptional regulator